MCEFVGSAAVSRRCAVQINVERVRGVGGVEVGVRVGMGWGERDTEASKHQQRRERVCLLEL